MVVKTVAMEPATETPKTSLNLKFGMDKILATEKSSTKFSSVKGSSHFTISPAFSDCIYNSLRCYANPPSRFSAPYIRQTLHAPQPLRPYTNVLVQSDITTEPSSSSNTHQKRKRSWSRAVFSNLQRKGLEKRFQLQKYITKPDRRQLAATLGLTDAQVKVWFQNRRMKWRHTKEGGKDNTLTPKRSGSSLAFADSTQGQGVPSDDSDSDVDVQTVDGELDIKPQLL